MNGHWANNVTARVSTDGKCSVLPLLITCNQNQLPVKKHIFQLKRHIGAGEERVYADR